MAEKQNTQDVKDKKYSISGKQIESLKVVVAQFERFLENNLLFSHYVDDYKSIADKIIDYDDARDLAEELILYGDGDCASIVLEIAERLCEKTAAYIERETDFEKAMSSARSALQTLECLIEDIKTKSEGCE